MKYQCNINDIKANSLSSIKQLLMTAMIESNTMIVQVVNNQTGERIKYKLNDKRRLCIMNQFNSQGIIMNTVNLSMSNDDIILSTLVDRLKHDMKVLMSEGLDYGQSKSTIKNSQYYYSAKVWRTVDRIFNQ